MDQKKGIESFKARWAWHPYRKEHEAGYTLFRKEVTSLAAEPYHLIVSADNRFAFYLDGKLLGRGPLRGDLDNYFYDEYKGVLSAGKHIFAAEVIVWSGAWRRSTAPWSEIHAGGGFMIAGYAGTEQMDLPEGWRTSIDHGRRPLPWTEAWDCDTMIPAPPMDEVDFTRYDCQWLSKEETSGEWIEPIILGNAEFYGMHQNDPDTPWNLRKRPLKPMMEFFTPIARILEGPDTLSLKEGHLTGELPAGKHRILLDLGRNQTSMVYFSGCGGKGKCRMAYSETLFNEKREKVRSYPGTLGGLGYADILIFPEESWMYHSFWYRTGKYIELTMELDQLVDQLDLEFRFITYPMEPFRNFYAKEDPILERIYQTACHTLLCCSHEGFEDCPYYEQLQYAGDSRIEALVSYAVSGKDDLGRHALKSIAMSQMGSGMTQSRYPSVFHQIIPEYSLIWALMLHDHYSFFHDMKLVKELLPQVEFMLQAFERARLPNGLIGSMPGWHYSDWVRGWPSGASDRGQDVPETILNLFYAEACNLTAELKEYLKQDTAELILRAERTLDAVNRLCYDPQRRRYIDSPRHPDWLSLHANTLAVLFGAVQEKERAGFLREICADPELKPMSLYFSFYLLSAIQKYGTPEELRKHYAPWEAMLAKGCTTFPERTDEWTRSDCHAWSCAPAWFLIQK